MIMVCCLESRLGIDKLWAVDQNSPATFVNKFLERTVCGRFGVTKVDGDPMTHRVSNVYSVNINKNLQRRFADP